MLPARFRACYACGLALRTFCLRRIGLLSDSHGRAATTRRAVSRLMEAGVDVILHLGDVGSVEVLDEMVVAPPTTGAGAAGAKTGAAVDVQLVFGNVDWDRASLARYAKHLGLHVADPVGTLELGDGRKLIFLHGDDADAMLRALESGAAYVCHGHSHRTRDERVGDTRVINPGALFRAQSYTVAILDTAKDQLEFLAVE